MSFKGPHPEGSFEHSIETETDNAIMSLASEMLTKKSSLLKKYDLSFQQFLILKTLSNAKGKPASIKSLTEEMLDKMSNTSRLVAKLEKKNFVDRKVSIVDRRQVSVIITKSGNKIFKKAASEMNDAIVSAYKLLSPSEMTVLLNLIQKLKKV